VVARKRKGDISWAPITGSWNIEDDHVSYQGPTDDRYPHGFVLSPFRLRAGRLSIKVTLQDSKDGAARILFGYSSSKGKYLSLGLGGYNAAYVLSEYAEGRGWRGLRTLGSSSNLITNSPYELVVELQGQRAILIVNNIVVMECDLPYPPEGNQVGLYAWGDHQVTFENYHVSSFLSQAFVVMQFSEPFVSFR